MSEYYGRDGRPISREEALSLWDIGNRRVASTVLPDGKWVSTVYMPLNHAFGEGPPLIFETMVFPSEKDLGELDMDRYSTEAEAIAGHAAMVEKWSGTAAEVGSE